jgi:hypothetical protein
VDGHSLLANSMIVIGCGYADGNRHTYVNLPIVLPRQRRRHAGDGALCAREPQRCATLDLGAPMKKQAFFRISSLVTASDLALPLGLAVSKDDNAFEAMMRLVEADTLTGGDRYSLVLDGSEVVGWWAPLGEDLNQGDSTTVEAFMEPIQLSKLVSGDLTYYDLADVFGRNHRALFVLDGSEITGWISHLSLFSRLGQICLLSLAFLLESAAEDLCLLKPVEAWQALPPNRQKALIDIAKNRLRDLGDMVDLPDDYKYARLLRVTSISDKLTMLLGARLVQAVPTDIENIFNQVKLVRDLCSHGADEQELNRQLRDFTAFLHSTLNLVEEIQKEYARVAE